MDIDKSNKSNNLLGNLFCNLVNDVVRIFLLHRENKEQICFTVQYSFVGNDFNMATWTSWGLSFFPLFSLFSNNWKRSAFCRALNRKFDLISNAHPWLIIWFETMVTLEDNRTGEDVTWECDDAAISILFANDFFTRSVEEIAFGTEWSPWIMCASKSVKEVNVAAHSLQKNVFTKDKVTQLVITSWFFVLFSL